MSTFPRSRASYSIVDMPSGAVPTPGYQSVSPHMPSAVDYQREAERAFHERYYADAARWTAHAILEDARNGRLHLLLAQACLASGDYPQAAASLRQGLELADRSEWGYWLTPGRSSLVTSYLAEQFAGMSGYIQSNPQLTDVRLLRGYCLLYHGQIAAAQADFQAIVDVQPTDALAASLLTLSENATLAPTAPEELPAPTPSTVRYGNSGR